MIRLHLSTFSTTVKKHLAVSYCTADSRPHLTQLFSRTARTVLKLLSTIVLHNASVSFLCQWVSLYPHHFIWYSIVPQKTALSPFVQAGVRVYRREKERKRASQKDKQMPTNPEKLLSVKVDPSVHSYRGCLCAPSVTIAAPDQHLSFT